MTPHQIRRAVRREVEKLEPLIKAIACVKTARGMADKLPDRAADPDGHDAQVKALHGTVRMARAALEEHLRSARALRLVGGTCGRDGSGPSGPSGTDNDQAYEPTGGDGLRRATDAIGNAADEADRLLDRLDDDDQAAVKDSANEVHFHVRAADAALEDYRAAVSDNPEGKARRARARAIAAVVLNGYGDA